MDDPIPRARRFPGRQQSDVSWRHDLSAGIRPLEQLAAFADELVEPLHRLAARNVTDLASEEAVDVVHVVLQKGVSPRDPPDPQRQNIVITQDRLVIRWLHSGNVPMFPAPFARLAKVRHSATVLHEALDTCQSVGVAPKNQEKPGVLVPFQFGSALRAPYGWTSRMRLEELWPQRGETKAIHIGFWANVTLALGVYGPYCLGIILGLFFLGGWRGVAVGFLAGLAVQIALLLLIGPIFIALRDRRFS